MAAALDLGLALDLVLVSESAVERFRALLTRIETSVSPALSPSISIVEPQLLDELADADAPRGIVATSRARDTSLESLSPNRSAVLLYCDRLQDPGNLGALARSAAAASADGLVLSPGTCHPFHPRALRASAGALLSLGVATDVSPSVLDEYLRSEWGATPWLGLTPTGGEPLWDASLSPPFVLAVGAEGQGLSPEVEERCRTRVSIPQDSAIESLNATVAASIVLFEWRRRQPLD